VRRFFKLEFLLLRLGCVHNFKSFSTFHQQKRYLQRCRKEYVSVKGGRGATEIFQHRNRCCHHADRECGCWKSLDSLCVGVRSSNQIKDVGATSLGEALGYTKCVLELDLRSIRHQTIPLQVVIE
jgi:hypothetical protein